MPLVNVTFLQPDGAAVTVAAEVGKSAMEAAIFNDVRGIAAECGGLCSCATCHVYVDPAWVNRLPPPAADEDDMLGFTAAPRLSQSRLACQLRLDASLDGLRLGLPPTQF